MTTTNDTPALRSDPEEEKTVSANVAGSEKKAPKTYCRIPITEDILRSVVPKPVVMTVLRISSVIGMQHYIVEAIPSGPAQM